MELTYGDKKIELTECRTFFERLKGFMFQNKIDKALLFNRCNSIHTFFMKKNIDVIMCNKENVILYYFKNLKKNRIIFPKQGVYKTIELPINYFDIRTNERIMIK